MQNLAMVPGLASDSTVWGRTILELNGEVNCLPADTLSGDSIPAMARRILENAPLEFALAGVSMGGMVALEMMRMAPERVTRLALVGHSCTAGHLRAGKPIVILRICS
jgi:pimeloyl-ACP methyl ester carboxylesterase